MKFSALHQKASAFVMPNPWDVGTARLLTSLDFEALGTTSAGYAFTQGVADGSVTRDATMAHIQSIVACTHLPVSADLGNGFHDSPEGVAECIRLAAAAGAVGASIEDASGNGESPIYEKHHAAERVCAASEAARSVGFPFTLTARSENFLQGRPDLRDTIERLQLFQQAGAHVLYAPGLHSREEIEQVVRSTDLPVNILVPTRPALSLLELSALGVKRASLGSSLSRATFDFFKKTASAMLRTGKFEPLLDGHPRVGQSESIDRP